MNFNQATCPARDVAAARDFYLRLGFTLIVDSAPHYVRLQAPQGGATLSLHHTEMDMPLADWPALYFECEDLDGRFASLKSAGVVFDSEPQDQTWLWREAWLKDPAGNRLCLYWAGENRLNPPWRVR
jgi:catechol 2,3-dioxygenase-like lactoylglutathione lyase family enzyme